MNGKGGILPTFEGMEGEFAGGQKRFIRRIGGESLVLVVVLNFHGFWRREKYSLNRWHKSMKQFSDIFQ
jgi:hypothetical protein